jgi:hypothetical protein
MKFLQVVLALALAGSMGPAGAATVGPGYLGYLGGQNVSIANALSGLGTPILDIYSFDIGSFAAETIATSVRAKLQSGSGSLPVYDISHAAITLGDTDGTVYGTDHTFDSSGALYLSAILPPSALGAPGFYPFVVTGTTAGTAGGIYAGALSAVPVPEPRMWMTLLAGLGLVGLMVERTKYRPG